MRITEFKELIRNLPNEQHSFDIKRKNWVVQSNQQIVDSIFEDKDVISLNRHHLHNSNLDLDNFIIKTLMWGYPTRGRGNNLNNILKKRNFEFLIEILEDYRDNEVFIEKMESDIKQIRGLGLSTMTKFTNFLNTTINGNKAVILDDRIIEAINKDCFIELEHLKGISISNGIKRYPEYLETINQLAKQIESEPEQIELFLFMFGRNLSELIGDNGE